MRRAAVNGDRSMNGGGHARRVAGEGRGARNPVGASRLVSEARRVPRGPVGGELMVRDISQHLNLRLVKMQFSTSTNAHESSHLTEPLIRAEFNREEPKSHRNRTEILVIFL